jgi:integrase
MENLKVTVNPARLIRPHQEDNARTRFLTHAEFDKLVKFVRRDHPEHAPSLIVATYSAMRWSEQFGLTWSQVGFKRMKIIGVKTKSARKSKVRRRDVPLNSVSAAALKEPQGIDGKHTGPKDIVFPRPGPYAD